MSDASVWQSRIPVSVIVMTRDEAQNIAKCLGSVTDFEEVFVVDSGSADGTCAIAEAMGAKVVEFRWNGTYPKKKQWCLENLSFTHDWVLYVDADEEVTPRLSREIRSLIGAGPRHAGYFVGYDYVFLGRMLSHGHRVYKLALFDRRKGRFVEYDDLGIANMWEVEGHYQPRIDGRVGRLRSRMVHNDHASLFHFFERHNRYSDWEAVLRARGLLVRPEDPQPGARAILKQIFRALPWRGGVAFLDSFLLRGGVMDGRAGFHFALARAFYYWQVGVKMREFEARQTRRVERREGE